MIIAIGSKKIKSTLIQGFEWNHLDDLFIIKLMAPETILKFTKLELMTYKTPNPEQIIKDTWKQDQEKIPYSITFFNNNTACVGNRFDRQIPKFQVGKHKDTIQALADAGYDWQKLPDIVGKPQL